MGRLTNTVRDRVIERNAQQSVPDWLPKLSIVVGVLVAVVMGFSWLFDSGGGDVSVEAPTRVIIPSVSDPAPGPAPTQGPGSDPADGPDTPDSPGVPDTGATRSVRNSAGAVLTVPAVAAELAERVGKGLESGDVASIPATGEPPVATGTAADPVVTALTVISNGEDRYEFSLSVAPAVGAAPTQHVVAVTRSGDAWFWDPEPAA
jgi:hypothetical protein